MNYRELGRLLLPRLREAQVPNSIIVWFVNSTETTVRNWKRGVIGTTPVSPPKGEQLNALWHLLAATGTPSTEMDDLPELHRYLGELLAFRAITLEEAQRICGSSSAQAVWEVTRGDRTPVTFKHATPNLREQYGAALETKKIELQTRLENFRRSSGLPSQRKANLTDQISRRPEVPEPAPAPESPPPLATIITADSSEISLVQLARELTLLLPALHHLLSEDCTAEQRERLRRLVGGTSTIERLSGLLQGLRSEHVRTRVLKAFDL